MAFKGQNFLAFFLTQVIVGLMFAAIFTDWYSWTTNFTSKNTIEGSGIQSISSTTQLNYSNIYYNGTGYRINARTSAQVAAKQEATTLYYNWGGENAGYAKVRRVSCPPQFSLFFFSFSFRLSSISGCRLRFPSSHSLLPASSDSTCCSFFSRSFAIITSNHAECRPYAGYSAPLPSASWLLTSLHFSVFLV
jgi:hypothetical protein